MLRVIVFCLAAPLLLAGCQKKDQSKVDQERIDAYLNDNNLNTEVLDSGLHYLIEEAGTMEEHPSSSAFVKVRYKGYLLDGTVFDQTPAGTSDADLTEFSLQNVIEGWKQGIPLFTKGGKGKLIIPSHLGYGAYAIGAIPANSVLIFDIELVDFRY